MTIPLRGWAFYDDGTPVVNATAQVYDQVPNLIATDTLDANGLWAFDGTVGHQAALSDGVTYDVVITNGGIVRKIKGGEKHQTASTVFFPVPYLDYIDQSSDPAAPVAGNSRVFKKSNGRMVTRLPSGSELPNDGFADPVMLVRL